MRILLIGEYYSTNLGDPVLCQTVENSIYESFPDVEVVPFDMSGNTGFNSRYTPKVYYNSRKILFGVLNRIPLVEKKSVIFRAIKPWQERYLITMCMLDHVLSLKKYDLAVFAGGSIFMDYFSGVIYGIIRQLSKKRIPVIFHACGMSKLTDDTTITLRKALKYKLIWVSALISRLQNIRKRWDQGKFFGQVEV